jgi:hypothetical protein
MQITLNQGGLTILHSHNFLIFFHYYIQYILTLIFKQKYRAESVNYILQ